MKLNFWGRSTIYKKLTFLGIWVLLLVGVIVYVALSGFSRIHDLDEVSDELKSFQATLIQTEADHLKWMTSLQEAFLVKKEGGLTIETDSTKCNFGQFLSGKELEHLIATIPETKKYFDKIKPYHMALHTSAQKIAPLLEKEETRAQAVAVFEEETVKNVAAVQSILHDIRTLVENRVIRDHQEIDGKMANTKLSISVASGFIFLLIGVVGFIVLRGITQKIAQMKKMVKQLAHGDGDLTIRIPVKGVNCSHIRKCNHPECDEYGKMNVQCWIDVGSWAPEVGREVQCPRVKKNLIQSCTECNVFQMAIDDELTELAAWINIFVEKLKNTILGVKRSYQAIYDATTSTAETTEELSRRTDTQAATVTQSIDTIEQFTASVRENSQNADDANTELRNFNSQLQQERDLIDSVNRTMQEINESGKKIDNIINVINDISFQTNLLALNAAVEAARAGEAGRGFAVVAAEVRNLAQKTAESSRMIQDIVSRNVTSTAKGMELVAKTSAFFQSIFAIMEDVTKHIQRISEGSTQQSENVEAINRAMSQLEEVISSNAQLVADLAGASRTMKTDSNELHRMMNKFNV